MLGKIVEMIGDAIGGGDSPFGARGANAAPGAGAGGFGSTTAAQPAGSVSAGDSGNARSAWPSPFMGMPRSGSALDALPAAARRRYSEILEAREELEAVAGALIERVTEAQATVLSAEARLAALRSRDGRQLADDEPAMIDARRKVAAARAELERVRGQQELHRERARPLRELAQAIESYVSDRLLRAEEILPSPAVPAPGMKPGESWPGVIEQRRERLRKLAEDAQAIEDAPWPSAIALERARAEIEGLAERGKPSIMSLIESQNGSIRWPTRLVLPHMLTGPNGPVFSSHEAQEFDALAFTVWLNREQLLARIEAEIVGNGDDKSALDAPTRQKKRLQIEAAILACEREEVAAIGAAREAGVQIAYRPDCDPRALLGLADTAPAPDRALI